MTELTRLIAQPPAHLDLSAVIGLDVPDDLGGIVDIGINSASLSARLSDLANRSSSRSGRLQAGQSGQVTVGQLLALAHIDQGVGILEPDSPSGTRRRARSR